MELLDGIETRKSFRAFQPTPVPEEVIRGILKVASKSPSYTNSQPWEVVVVGGEKIEELSRILCTLVESDTPPNPDLPAPKNWPPELDRRTKEHGSKRLRTLGIERTDEQQRKDLMLANYKFYGAPCALFLYMDSTLSSWSIFDIGLFAQSIILAAHAVGLGSCLQATLASYPDAIRKFFGIPKTKHLILGISIGYPNLKAPINTYQSERVSLDNFVQWQT